MSSARALHASVTSVLHSKQLGKLKSRATVGGKKARYLHNLYLFITVPCGGWPRAEAFCAGNKKLHFFWHRTTQGLTVGFRLNTHTGLQSTLMTATGLQ